MKALIIFSFLVVGLTACMSSPKEDETTVKEDLSGEVSLKADRSYLDEARQNIPAEIKKANDDIKVPKANLPGSDKSFWWRNRN